MTDRIKSLTVVLEEDVREDDCQAIIQAIKMIRRVSGVRMHVADHDHFVAVENAKAKLRRDLWGLLE